MICRAAVKIFDKRQDKEIIIPCHRHSDAYKVLYNFNYRKNIDYFIIEKGFLNEDDIFLNRREAYLEAKQSNQLLIISSHTNSLYSEDLW